MSCRGMIIHALAALGPASQPGQISLGTGFIQKDQAIRVKRCALARPSLAGQGYIRPGLFAGPECLFLYVRFIPAKA